MPADKKASAEKPKVYVVKNANAKASKWGREQEAKKSKVFQKQRKPKTY